MEQEEKFEKSRAATAPAALAELEQRNPTELPEEESTGPAEELL